MKRMALFSMTSVILFFSVLSCADENLVEEVVSVDGLEALMEFSAVPADGMSFTISSNVNWSVSVNDLDWVNISPSRGLADEEPVTVTIVPSVNEMPQERKGTLIIHAGSFSCTSELRQAASSLVPVFDISGLDDAQGGTQGGAEHVLYIEANDLQGRTFKVASNRDWSASAEGLSWATVSPLSGGKNRSAIITVIPKSANDGQDRNGILSFDYGSGQPETVRIIHKKFVPEISLSTDRLVAFSTGNLDNPEVIVTSNGDWTAECSKPWITVDKMQGTIGETVVKVSIQPNDEGIDRDATVTFSNEGEKAVLSVMQGSESLTSSVKELSVSSKAAALTFDISSNVEWSVTSSEPWAKVSPESGSGNAVITVNVEKNESATLSRTASITVAAKQLPDLFHTVTLTQRPDMFISLDVPVVFNSNDQAWNMEHNPDYASEGQTGVVTGKGSGRLCSYTYPDNPEVFVKMESENSYGLIFLMSKEGNITFKNIWTDDAAVFHIPVRKIAAGSTLCFDYGVMGTKQCPMYWTSEASTDGGKTWKEFETGSSFTANNGSHSNTNVHTTAKKETWFQGVCTIEDQVEDCELLIRIRCVDGSYTCEKKIRQSPHASGTVRIIGYNHEHEQLYDEVMGPKIYLK